jgi:hypothetical protein
MSVLRRRLSAESVPRALGVLGISQVNKNGAQITYPAPGTGRDGTGRDGGPALPLDPAGDHDYYWPRYPTDV